jgi:hypothetical protein
VAQDLRDDHWVFDTGDDPHCLTAARAGLDVDAKYPFQALRPDYGNAALLAISKRPLWAPFRLLQRNIV